MPSSLFTWTKRLAVLAAAAGAIAVVARILGSTNRSGATRSEVLPSIGGDTWPPVPTNSNRAR